MRRRGEVVTAPPNIYTNRLLAVGEHEVAIGHVFFERLDESAEVQLRKHRLPAPVALAGRIALALPALAAPELVQRRRLKRVEASRREHLF